MLIYLASPFTSDNPDVRRLRYEWAREATVAIFKSGRPVFSPIVYSYALAESCGLPVPFDFWREFDEAMIARCSFLWVLTLPGWEVSKGVQAEIDIAAKHDKPMRCYSLSEIVEGRF